MNYNSETESIELDGFYNSTIAMHISIARDQIEGYIKGRSFPAPDQKQKAKMEKYMALLSEMNNFFMSN